MTEVIGHKKILTYFSAVKKHDRFSHAYCFVGSEHAGKRRVAEEISTQLLGCNRDDLYNHPDVLYIAQEKNSKTGKTKKDIDIAQLLHVHDRLLRKSFLGGYTIVIIDGAEKMNISASNALLKSLEEPRGKTLFFLLTNDEKKLLPTIWSRCQGIFFHPVAQSEIEVCVKKDISENEKKELLFLSRGLPGRIMYWQENPEEYELYKKEIHRFVNIFGKSFHEKREDVEELFGDKTDNILARKNLVAVLDIWKLVIHDCLQNEFPGITYEEKPLSLPSRLTPEIGITLYSFIEESQQLLQKNIHPRLLIEKILIHIP